MGTNGKGSARRPSSVPKSVFDENFDRVFGNRLEPCVACNPFGFHERKSGVVNCHNCNDVGFVVLPDHEA